MDCGAELCLAKVLWFEHPVETASLPGSVGLWCRTLLKPFGPASFIPITRIKEICITCELTIGGEPVLAVNPIRKRSSYKTC